MAKPSTKKVRTRILITNGERTIDLFWLSHSGEDLYYVMPKTN